MEELRDILDEKGRRVWSVRPDDTVYRALEVMAEANIGALVVLTDSGELVGVVSERDIARHGVSHKADLFDLPVREIMSRRIRSAPAAMSIDTCMALMTAERVRHVPVFEGERLDGIVSIGDVVKAMVHEKDIVIEQLEHYISSSL
ncbi:MAG: CBS domain-containing protein [Spirochaetota bacterium]